MSIASPTLRSSSSTVPGPSLSKSPTSILARPSTADTCTGTSNTASRSAAPRLVSPLSANVFGSTGGIAPDSGSRLGSGTLLSLIARLLIQLWRNLSKRGHRGGLPCPEVTSNGIADGEVGLVRVADDPAVGPFDLAIADRDLGLGDHHDAALEAAGAGDLVEPGAGDFMQGVVDAHYDVRRRGEMLEAFGGERRDLGEGLAQNELGGKLARDCSRKLHGFGFEPAFDRGKAARQAIKRIADLFERDRHAACGDRGAFLFGRGK